MFDWIVTHTVLAIALGSSGTAATGAALLYRALYQPTRRGQRSTRVKALILADGMDGTQGSDVSLGHLFKAESDGSSSAKH